MAETIESLSRGLDVLRLLESADDLTLSDIARGLGLSLPRTHRILATLERSGFVFRSAQAKSYRLSFGNPEQGAADAFERVLEAAYPALESLRDESGETAHLAMLAGRHIYFVASVESPQVMRVTSRVGRRVPAPVTAAGKVLLAHRPDDQVQALLAGLDASVRQRLSKEIAEARRTGLARNLGESEVGMATMSAAIRLGGTPPSHALSISGPESRINPSRSIAMTAVERRFGQLLTRAAAQVSAALIG